MSLREFVELLRREGELAVVTAPVDPYLEMAEIADRASKAGGPALLFERPVTAAVAGGALPANAHCLSGPPLPVLMNQFGSYRRLELALGAPLDELAARIGELVELQIPKGLVGKVKALGQLRELASFTPKVVGKAAFRDIVVEPPDLGRLPVLTTWPGDGGPFVTLPVVVTKDRDGRRNAGMYRLQIFDAPRPACTGTSITTGRPTSARPTTVLKWPSLWAPTRPSPMPLRRRCRPASTSSCSPAFCAASPSSSPPAPRSTSRCPPTPRSCSKATSTRPRRAARDRSAITPATTRWPTTTPSFTSPP